MRNIVLTDDTGDHEKRHTCGTARERVPVCCTTFQNLLSHSSGSTLDLIGRLAALRCRGNWRLGQCDCFRRIYLPHLACPVNMADDH